MRQHILAGISRKITEIKDIPDIQLLSDSLGDLLPIHMKNFVDARSDCAVS